MSWRVLTAHGHRVTFATPDGRPGEGDDIMLTGVGLDWWGRVPLLKHLAAVGLMLRANGDARAAYRAMIIDPAFLAPIRWEAAAEADFDGLLLPGGHRARGMREYLESPTLQALVAAFFAADKPVAAICHGVLLAARSQAATGQSVLYGRKTTALTWRLEGSASKIARLTRRWDPDYYRTYPDGPHQPEGYMSVQQEVTRALADPADFIDVAPDAADHSRKTSGLSRDSLRDERPAWVVRDGTYLSARWPGDAHTFARQFAEILPA
ncbi:type 1 glutamine amidotransferase domain-containing protein [Sphingomonas panacisoli]|uniref:type 1 glutamine amidotransferase domain-containing protein n=1 Tax=Sphingomonas panacisoli TaxID=1813879 RepID=UPI001F021748|nr:type 1 glutamine amidotransferase domain-containing protein [Sphingomonas panacisoli]